MIGSRIDNNDGRDDGAHHDDIAGSSSDSAADVKASNSRSRYSAARSSIIIELPGAFAARRQIDQQRREDICAAHRSRETASPRTDSTISLVAARSTRLWMVGTVRARPSITGKRLSIMVASVRAMRAA